MTCIARYTVYILIAAGVFLVLAGCGKDLRKGVEIRLEPVKLDVVYPRIEEGDSVFVVPRVDSTFALGLVYPENSSVYVNGLHAKVYENGAFLAFFPLDTLTQRYHIWAIDRDGNSSTISIPFYFPDQIIPASKILPIDTINSCLPARITIASANAVLRTDPNRAWWLFPAAGSTALADSFVYPYYRIPLAERLHAWVENRFVELDAARTDKPASILYRISVSVDETWTQIRLPLEEPHIFRLEARSGEGALRVDLYGVSAYIDQIKYDASDPVVGHIRWDQVEDDLLRLEILLKTPRLWGYSAFYDGNTLVIRIRKPPEIRGKALKGRTIVLDPGHGGEYEGAIGPTRLCEKDPNLRLAESLKNILEKEGVRVYLTRTSDSTVGIYDRIDFALRCGAEILLSLHNNALPDGENPFIKRGSSVYYYHPQSRDLAWYLHKNLLKTIELKDNGLYYKNLALARPTEMLAVLVESAFIIHPEEEMLLRDDRFIRRVAQGIADGIEEFLRQCRKKDSKKIRTFHTWPSSYRNMPGWSPLNPSK